MTNLALLVGLATCVVAANAFPTGGSGSFKEPDGYFMYLNVPGPKEYEAGFNRGNDKHHISRFEQLKDHRFRTRVKWSDAKDGYGEHYFEYNHAPKHPEHHGGYDHEPHHDVSPFEHHQPSPLYEEAGYREIPETPYREVPDIPYRDLPDPPYREVTSTE